MARFGATPLHWACLKARAPLVYLLLSAGADPLVRATAGIFNGRTALDLAKAESHSEAVVEALTAAPTQRLRSLSVANNSINRTAVEAVAAALHALDLTELSMGYSYAGATAEGMGALGSALANYAGLSSRGHTTENKVDDNVAKCHVLASRARHRIESSNDAGIK